MAEVDDVSLLIALRYLREVAGPAPFEEFRRRVIDLAPSQESLMITAAQFDFERGREQGLRASVSTLLVQRFGPLDDEAQAWIAQASAPRLSRALARVLTAPTVAAVLTDE